MGGQGSLGQQVGTLVAELLCGSPQSVESHPGKQLWAGWLRRPQEECLRSGGRLPRYPQPQKKGKDWAGREVDGHLSLGA